MRRILKVRKEIRKENGLIIGAEKKKKKKTFSIGEKEGQGKRHAKRRRKNTGKTTTCSVAQEKERTFLDKCSHNLLLQDTKLD